MKGFLDHWRPDLAVFTESEIWPNLILESAARDIPLALINARMTKRSFRRWRRNPGVARPAVQPLRPGAGAERRAGPPLQGARRAAARRPPATSRSTRRRRRSNMVELRAPEAGARRPRAADRGQHARGRGRDHRRRAPPAAPEPSRSVHHHRAAPSRARRRPSPRCWRVGACSVARRSLGAAARTAPATPTSPTPSASSACSTAGAGRLHRRIAGRPRRAEPDRGGAPGRGRLTGPHWQNFADAYRALISNRAAIVVRSAPGDWRAPRASCWLTRPNSAACAAAPDAALATISGALPRTVEALLRYLPRRGRFARAS